MCCYVLLFAVVCCFLQLFAVFGCCFLPFADICCYLLFFSWCLLLFGWCWLLFPASFSYCLLLFAWFASVCFLCCCHTSKIVPKWPPEPSKWSPKAPKCLPKSTQNCPLELPRAPRRPKIPFSGLRAHFLCNFGPQKGPQNWLKNNFLVKKAAAMSLWLCVSSPPNFVSVFCWNLALFLEGLTLENIDFS